MNAPSYIVFKEFPPGDCPKMDFLQQLGYRRFSSPAMNTFDRPFADLDAYIDALRSRYRQCVRKSLEKSRAADLRYEQADGHGRDTPPVRPVSPSALRGGRPFLGAPPRAPPALVLPRPGTAPPGLVGLTLVYAGDRVAAFNWNLFHEGVYHLLFAGLDYDLNPSLDLYFNLMYAEMDQAFRAGAETLVFGQTADDFKVATRMQTRSGDSSTSHRWASSRYLILQAAGRLPAAGAAAPADPPRVP